LDPPFKGEPFDEIAFTGDATGEMIVEIDSGSVVKGDKPIEETGVASATGEVSADSDMVCNLASTAVGETPSRDELPFATTSLRSTGVFVPILVGVPRPLDGAGGGLCVEVDSFPLFVIDGSTEAKEDRSSILATDPSRPLLELEVLKIDESRRFEPDLLRLEVSFRQLSSSRILQTHFRDSLSPSTTSPVPTSEPLDVLLLFPNLIERDLDILRSAVEESSSGAEPFPRACCWTDTDEVDRRNNLDMANWLKRKTRFTVVVATSTR
jgi:hypothetical protein